MKIVKGAFFLYMTEVDSSDKLQPGGRLLKLAKERGVTTVHTSWCLLKLFAYCTVR
jgi:hypothetical protein